MPKCMKCQSKKTTYIGAELGADVWRCNECGIYFVHKVIEQYMEINPKTLDIIKRVEKLKESSYRKSKNDEPVEPNDFVYGEAPK